VRAVERAVCVAAFMRMRTIVRVIVAMFVIVPVVVVIVRMMLMRVSHDRL